MNKSKMMKKAHLIASLNVAKVGDYMVALKLALKKVWADIKEQAAEAQEVGSVAIKNAYSIKDSLKAFGAKWDAAAKAWIAPKGGKAHKFAEQRAQVVISEVVANNWNAVINEGGEGYRSNNW
ncbi:MAG: hypothetical protein IBX55_13950 [Methyloprofundus sp.]|nr:hypothetical protein [Methyloprofundus sp.]